MNSIGSEGLINNLLKGELSSFWQLTSSGKSGSLFYYSSDGKFILKTIHKEEFDCLFEILPNYYNHIDQNPRTLIARFFGLHRIFFEKSALKSQETIYFVIMNNVFETKKEIHVRYDLKGSSYKRETHSKVKNIFL